ncbi:hypothetical protein CKO25_12470 [Thiocapsa imhoffii]|uniref:Uncharacterized protein n=2 Tax=Thiocapsa imhoffii TaxID=382777 RepID=A0A9X0WJG5_9GAMM|nr:hypothetical protein [Thiocapsa imhoffii]
MALALSSAPSLALNIAPEQLSLINLHPEGADHSRALGVSNGRQVGVVIKIGEGYDQNPTAALWHGSADSLIRLSPFLSTAYAIDHDQQGGFIGMAASLWEGSPESQLTLLTDTSLSYQGGVVRALDNGWQAGEVRFPCRTEDPTVPGVYHAAIWNAAAVPDGLPTILHFGEECRESIVWGIDGATATDPGQQVGSYALDGRHQAMLWSGSADSVVNLNPTGSLESVAYGINNGRQVGYYSPEYLVDHAVVWHGTAEGAIDLHPRDMDASYAFAIDGPWVVGTMYPDESDDSKRAVLWNLADHANPIDLSALLPEPYNFAEAMALEADRAGNLVIVGSVFNPTAGTQEAVLWTYRPVLFAAVLPAARAVAVGQPASAFANLINTGSATAEGCSIGLPEEIAATFIYQATDAENRPVGIPNTPVDLPPDASQGFVFSITPTGPLATTDIPLLFKCENAGWAPSQSFVNTLTLTAMDSAPPDLLAIGVTPSGDGVVRLNGAAGIGVFATAAINLGPMGELRVSADTRGLDLPLNLTVCETDAAGNWLSCDSSALNRIVAAGETLFYSVFATGKGEPIDFDPAAHRILLRFESDGMTVGATSAAVMTH